MTNPETSSPPSLEELEAKLLRQEHRLFPLVRNFLERKKKYPEDNDERRKAVTNALLFNLLLSPQSVALGGGILALLSILLLGYQSYLMRQTVYPSPRYTALVRPLAPSNAADAGERAFPDLAIDERDFEMAFTANGAGPILIDAVNLKVDYMNDKGEAIRTDYFESRSSGQLSVVGKASIEACKLTFKRFGHSEIDNISEQPGPVTPVFTFAVGGVDSDGDLWSVDIISIGVLIDSGKEFSHATDLYLTKNGESLMGVLERRPPIAKPAHER